MSLVKIASSSKALKASVLYRDYSFTLMILIFLTSLLAYQNVFASSSMQKTVFSQNIGYTQQHQRADFAEAKIAYDNQDYIYSSRLLSILAEQGHDKAQYLLATQYDVGLGVDIDKQAAFTWYQQAAWAGLRVAQHNLAVSYAKGQGTEINLSKAIYWWKRAAKSGNTDAQYNLGIIYASGHGSIEPNLAKALKWWRMAAMGGDAVAQFNLGALYANGIGMSSRTCEASRWWKKSAENGFAQAEMALAILQTKSDYAICQ